MCNAQTGARLTIISGFAILPNGSPVGATTIPSFVCRISPQYPRDLLRNFANRVISSKYLIYSLALLFNAMLCCRMTRTIGNEIDVLFF